MTKVKKLSILAFILIAVGVIGSLSTYHLINKPDSVFEQKVIEQTNNITKLDIRLNNSDVNLLSTQESTIRIELTGRARTTNNLVTATEGNALTIRMNNEKTNKLFNMDFFEPSFQLNVYVPEKQYEDIVIDIDNGGIEAKELQVGQFKASTVNGRIELDHITAQQVNTYSENGKLLLHDITGELTGQSVNGMITLDTASMEQDVKLDSENGSIHIQTDVAPSNATFKVKTDNGSIDILGEYTSNVVIGKGENLIELSTSNGSIIVSK